MTAKVKFLSFVLLASLSMGCAEIHDAEIVNFGSHHLPVQFGPSDLHRKPYASATASAIAVPEVRVKIFPHNDDKYNAPAGADTVWERATLQTSGTCSAYKAEDDTSVNPRHASTAAMSGKTLKLNAATLPYAMWIKCTVAPKLIRVGYERKAIYYPGKFFVKLVKPRDRKPYITVVNVVSETQYLKGVVPAEMPASWPYEALRVQAVAARTYFRYELATNVAANDPQLIVENSGAQLEDTVMYQAYLGVYGNAASNQAVEDTANEVMTYKGGVIKAYFSADSGGHTENAENVWGVFLPYVVGKPEPYPHGTVSISDWKVTKTYRDIQERLLALNLIDDRSAITSVAVASLFPFGRTKEVKIKFASGKTKVILGVDFAHAVGLRSNWLKLTGINHGIQINGRGFGHGVGMNQWGSRALVSQYSRSYKQILTYYYTGIKIERL